MKTIVMLTAILLAATSSFAQLKVDATGRIGMGTNYPNTGYKCHIQGNLLLTNYPATPGYELTARVIGTNPEIGSNSDILNFWYSSTTGYNKLQAESYSVISDSSLKSDIKPIVGGLDKIMNLHTYHYSMEDNRIVDGNVIPGSIKKYGFMSQEVERLFPDVKITNDANGYKLMEYDQIIPLTVAAIKEQQQIIEELKTEIESLRANQISGSSGLGDSKTFLIQNKPNPFKDNTTIGYEIQDRNFRSASIMLFDMNGSLLKTCPIQKSGKGELIINGSELKAGMYIYTLIVNDKEADTKRMILVN